MFLFLWNLVLGTLLLQKSESVNVSDKHRLLQDLLDNYPSTGKYVLPLRNTQQQPISVELGIEFLRIISVDRAKQTVTFKSYNSYMWPDEYLTWDPDLFGGVDSLMMPLNAIWVPDIAIYDLVAQSCIQDGAAVVTSSGRVTFVPSCTQEIRCFVDVTYFPFDKHSCSINLGSWTHSNESLILGSHNVHKTSKTEWNDEWDMYKVTSRLDCYPYGGKQYPYIFITFLIQHHAALFAFLLILPAVLLSVMTSVVFLLPSDDDNKINIGLSIFLSFMVLLHILMDMTPQSSSSVPCLGYYFTVNSFLIAMSVFSATITANVCGKAETGYTMPPWLKKIMILMAKTLRVNTGPTNKDGTWKPNQEFDDLHASMNPNGMRIAEHGSNRRDWIQLAWTLDRLFFLIYMTINVVATMIIFVQYTTASA